MVKSFIDFCSFSLPTTSYTCAWVSRRLSALDAGIYTKGIRLRGTVNRDAPMPLGSRAWTAGAIAKIAIATEKCAFPTISVATESLPSIPRGLRSLSECKDERACKRQHQGRTKIQKARFFTPPTTHRLRECPDICHSGGRRLLRRSLKIASRAESDKYSEQIQTDNYAERPTFTKPLPMAEFSPLEGTQT